MINDTDTIAAIATAVSSSGIGIIRVSGQDAFLVVSKIFRMGGNREIDLRMEDWDRRVLYGHICDGEEVVDEVLILVMSGPHSYTAEDTVEIDCHGGVVVMRRIPVSRSLPPACRKAFQPGREARPPGADCS